MQALDFKRDFMIGASNSNCIFIVLNAFAGNQSAIIRRLAGALN